MSKRGKDSLELRKKLISKIDDDVHDTMDEWMKQCCLELLSFLAKHNVSCEVDGDGKEFFYYKGEMISREELFENFL